MNLTLFAANALLDGIAMPATLYVQQHIGDPGEDCTANQSAADRVAFTRSAAIGGGALNAVPILWNPYGLTETVTHLSLWDDLSAGDPWWVGEWNTPEGILPSDVAGVVPGGLSLSLDYWS